MDLLVMHGFTKDDALAWLWNQTAYPMGDNALERVREFLALPTHEQRQAWMDQT